MALTGLRKKVSMYGIKRGITNKNKNKKNFRRKFFEKANYSSHQSYILKQVNLGTAPAIVLS